MLEHTSRTAISSAEYEEKMQDVKPMGKTAKAKKLQQILADKSNATAALVRA